MSNNNVVVETDILAAERVKKQAGRIATGLKNTVVGEVTDWFWAATWAIGFFIASVAVGLYNQVHDNAGINIFISLIWVAATVGIVCYPENAFWLTLVKKFGATLKLLVMVETVVFFYLANVPFKENPVAFFAIIVGGTAISMMASTWKKELGGTVGIELIYSGLCAMVIMDFMSLFPAEFWTGGSQFLASIATLSHRPGMSLFILVQTALYIFFGRRAMVADKKMPYMLAFAALGVVSWLVIPSVSGPPKDGAGTQVVRVSKADTTHDVPLVTTEKLVSVAPGGTPQTAPIPYGTKVIHDTTWHCNQGCVLEIEHDGDLLCRDWNGTEQSAGWLWHTGYYKGTPCMVTVVDANANRFREDFLIPAGPGKIEFPKNLVHVISSIKEGSDVMVSTITSR